MPDEPVTEVKLTEEQEALLMSSLACREEIVQEANARVAKINKSIVFLSRMCAQANGLEGDEFHFRQGPDGFHVVAGPPPNQGEADAR